MYLGATYPGAYGGSAVEPCVGQGIALLPLTAIGVGKSVRRGTGTSPLVLATSGTGKTTKRGTGVVTLTLATTGAGKSPKRGTGLAVLPLAAVGVGEAIEMPVAEGFAPLFLEVEGFGAGEGEYYGEARPDETLDEGDWIPVAAASLEEAAADEVDASYMQSGTVPLVPRTIELLEGSAGEPLLVSLMAFWELEEASGIRNDSYGTNHLTDNNTVTQATGKVGQSAQFTAANSPHELLDIADNAALSTGDIDFTISAWVRLDSFPGASAQTVVSKWTTVGNREYLLYISSSTSTLWFQTTSGFVEATIIGALSINTWYLIVAWHDSVNNLVGVAVNAGTANTGSATGTANPNGTAPFSIGGRSDQSLGTFLDGRIDQVGFWKRVLTADERTWLYNAGAGRSYASLNPTVRATRTVESSGGGWIDEEFLLSGPEKVSITSWADIRVRITDGGDPVILAFPPLITPPSNVKMYIRSRLESKINGYNLKTNLVGFWELEETSGTRLDSHGTNHLTDNNTVLSAAGKVGTAADFERDNSESLSVADNAALSLGLGVSFTVCAWVKAESIPAGSMFILGKDGAGGGEYALWYVNGTSRFRFSTWGSASYGDQWTATATSLGAPSAGIWYFIVAWYDAVADTMNIQVNNSTVDSQALATLGAFDGSAEFRIGRDNSTLYWDGLIDQVGIWKRVLTANERTWLYNLGAGRAYSELGPPVMGADLLVDLVSLWEMNEPANSIRYDAHGTNHLTPVLGTLTKLGAFWEMEETGSSASRLDSQGQNHLTVASSVNSTTGKVGNAAEFFGSGTPGRLDAAHHASLSPGDIDFTVAAWVWLDLKHGTIDDAIICKIGGGHGEWLLDQNKSPGIRYRFIVFGAAAGGNQTPVGATTFGFPPDGVWHFVIGFHDATANTVNIQVNDGAVDSAAHTFGAYQSAGSPVHIGQDTLSGQFDGRIDQVGFWLRKLTTAEKTWLYNSGAGRSYAAMLAESTTGVGQSTGKVGDAAHFTASLGEYLRCADNADLSGGDNDLTIAAWVYLDTLPPLGVILEKEGEYRLYYVSGTNRFVAEFRNGATSVSAVAGQPTPATGTWYHIVAWHDSVNNVCGIRVNAHVDYASSAFTTGMGNTANPLLIGSLAPQSYQYPWDGRIDQVGIWKRVLTPAERTWLYNDGAGRAYSEISGITILSDLIAMWEFENPANLGESSHGSNDMTNVDAVSSTTGIVGSALDVEYDSVGHLKVTDPPFSYIGDGDWTVMAWVKLESAAHLYSLISKGDVANPEWHLQFNTTGEKFRLQVFAAASGGSGTTLTSTMLTATNTWYLVLAWHDAAAGTIHIQINNNVPESVAHAGGAYNGAGDITIGTDASGNRFDGLIDQVAIWARKLSPDERRWLYNGGAGRVYSEFE